MRLSVAKPQAISCCKSGTETRDELNRCNRNAHNTTYVLKSDTVAVLAVLPRYPCYYRGNGYNVYSITAVLGPKCTGFPWG